MGGSVAQLYNAVVKGETPQAPAVAPPPPPPSPVASTDATSDADKKQRQAQGAAATIFAGRSLGGSGGLMSSGSGQSQRMLLGS